MRGTYSHRRRRCPHLGAGAALVLLAVVDKQLGELLRRGIVGRLVAPGIAWPEDLRRHIRGRGHHVEAEHWVTLRLRVAESAAVDRVEDGAGMGELDAFADAVAAAAPAGVDQ